ncbi:MAG: type II secretion system protein J [Wujia sp.]
MKKKKSFNSGYTLIELIIAMAILAFLMTALSSIMSTSVMSFKKAKADIAVHNGAQDTYNQLIDSFMQSSNVVIYGYITTNKDDEIDFSVSDVDTDVAVKGNATYFVKDEAAKDAFKLTPEYTDTSAKWAYFESVPSDVDIYVKQMIIDVPVAIDKENVPGDTDLNPFTALNSFTGQMDTITQKTKDYSTDPLNPDIRDVEDSLGRPVYDVNDTMRKIFTFDGKNMYYECKYAYQTMLNDYYNSAGKPVGSITDSMKNYLYNDSFAFVNLPDGSDTITGCIVNLTASQEAVEIKLEFNDKNMTYTSQGLVKVRNSYVLKVKK